MLLGLVIVLFPVKIVQKTDDTPEFLIFGIELPCEITHGLLDRFPMLDMKRILVMIRQKRKRLFSRHSCLKLRHTRLLFSRLQLVRLPL